ncbi:Zinc finger domain-containing protein, CCCH-type [Hirsutella rhossiliensis]|uniref:Zinc finger domain-containing protein, CCCH-type n=1 Tax=Hirsutella rhossiliensis TaxID=111463 RepID=A0A9P8N3D8_9HYPO|nr:Zinc finger domain-containing protein, CCCH-type [Hirsutella rhossiliensis]KAH0963972.1 Zinc finger domain-containing protein, CCCH-type [Hirsutella rhossiliensis]
MPQERPSRSRKESQVYRSDRRSLSTAASERLPLIEARRKEQLLKLQSLQIQIAKVEQEIAEGMREEQNLKQDLVSDDSDRDESHAAPRTAPFSANGSPEGSSVNYGNTSAKAPKLDTAQKSQESTDSEDENSAAGRVEAPLAITAGQAAVTLNKSSIPSAQLEHDDVVMEEAEDCTGMDSEEGSDDYEPPDAEPSSSQEFASPSLQIASANEKHAFPQLAEDAAEAVPTPAASAQEISADQTQPAPEIIRGEKGDQPSESRREYELPERAFQRSQGSILVSPQPRFVPYETPLQYFRAFRFHPEFSKYVTGGLRSLTYSNKIDVRKEVCPDELAGQACPRGGQCEYQHFGNMKAPDEQILLQLGAAGNYQAEQKQEYIAGLRQLLTDFRNRKVKDFDTISRGIVDYRAQFLKDRSKILPLSGVTI